MQYLLMCCINEGQWERLSESDRDAIMQEYQSWVRGTEESGHHLASARLHTTSSATTIRMKNGKPVMTDGPFAETHEQLGGYHLLECRNLDEAISLAARIPTLRVGGAIEVRPLRESQS